MVVCGLRWVRERLRCCCRGRCCECFGAGVAIDVLEPSRKRLPHRSAVGVELTEPEAGPVADLGQLVGAQVQEYVDRYASLGRLAGPTGQSAHQC